MGARQLATIARAVDAACNKVHSPEGREPAACATLTAHNRAGDEVWIQVTAGNINMAYPCADDPVARLRQANIFGAFKADLIDWNAGTFVTWDSAAIPPRDLALIVDRLFTAILGCDDATYAPTVTMEDLDA
jgi:hypothetical protein